MEPVWRALADLGFSQSQRCGFPFSFLPMATKKDLPASAFARLCAIQKHLHRWAEDECNGFIQYEDTECAIPWRYCLDQWGTPTVKSHRIVNKEAKYLLEAQELAAQCGGFVYHQTDPRGCALYFYRPADLEGRRFPIDQCYSSVALACC
jgi:hypothetical protein